MEDSETSQPTSNFHLPSSKSPLVVIVGETASGKSALAMELAQKYNGELICADSWTVYPGFNIGTAKPSAFDQAKVPHHMLDVADPNMGYSAAVYKDAATKAIADIQARGKLPIMVGGTGLYIDSVIYDYSFLPKSDAGLRDELNEMTLDELLMRAEQEQIDLEGIDIRNKRRVIRAIENNGQRPGKSSLRKRTLILGIKRDNEQLEDRITKRVDAMFAAGLEIEVDHLRQLYGWGNEAMKGIGYREWQGYFNGTQSLEQTRVRVIRASLGLAKRQRTWFKRNPEIQWCDDYERAVIVTEHFFA